MKKTILSICLLATTTFAFAQKPATGDHSFTFGVSGISTIGVSTPNFTSSLLFKHYLSDNMAARVGINFSSTSAKTADHGDSLTSTVKTSGWGLNLGAQHSFMGTDRLDPYIGADLQIGSEGGKTEAHDSYTSPGTVTDMKTEGGSTFSFGIVPCVGFTYYFTDWFGFGAEFGWGISMSSTGESTSTTTVASGGTTTVTTSKSGTSKANEIGTSGSGMVTVTIGFH